MRLRSELLSEQTRFAVCRGPWASNRQPARICSSGGVCCRCPADARRSSQISDTGDRFARRPSTLSRTLNLSNGLPGCRPGRPFSFLGRQPTRRRLATRQPTGSQPADAKEDPKCLLHAGQAWGGINRIIERYTDQPAAAAGGRCEKRSKQRLGGGSDAAVCAGVTSTAALQLSRRPG